MNLFRLVPARSWLVAAVAVIAGLSGGVFSAALIAVINRALNNTARLGGSLAVGFFGLLVGRAIANAAARLLLNHSLSKCCLTSTAT